MVANRFLTKSMTVVVPSSDQKMFSRTCGCSSSKDCSGLLKKISQCCFCSTLIVALWQKLHASWVFLNENHKLKMNHSKIKCDIWERLGSRSLGVPDPLSAEVNDASTWRIGVPDVHFTCASTWRIGVPDVHLLMTVVSTMARVVRSRMCGGQWDTAVKSHRRLSHIIHDDASLLSWATFFVASEQWDWCPLVPWHWWQLIGRSQTRLANGIVSDWHEWLMQIIQCFEIFCWWRQHWHAVIVDHAIHCINFHVFQCQI